MVTQTGVPTLNTPDTGGGEGVGRVHTTQAMITIGVIRLSEDIKDSLNPHQFLTSAVFHDMDQLVWYLHKHVQLLRSLHKKVQFI